MKLHAKSLRRINKSAENTNCENRRIQCFAFWRRSIFSPGWFAPRAESLSGFVSEAALKFADVIRPWAISVFYYQFLFFHVKINMISGLSTSCAMISWFNLLHVHRTLVLWFTEMSYDNFRDAMWNYMYMYTRSESSSCGLSQSFCPREISRISWNRRFYEISRISWSRRLHEISRISGILDFRSFHAFRGSADFTLFVESQILRDLAHFVESQIARDFSHFWNLGSPFSSPEAALLLVSTKNRDLWPSQRSNDWAFAWTRAWFKHFRSISLSIPQNSSVNLRHSSHLSTKFNHSAPTNILFPSFTA